MIQYFTVVIYNGFDGQLDVESSKRCLRFDVHLKEKYNMLWNLGQKENVFVLKQTKSGSNLFEKYELMTWSIEFFVWLLGICGTILVNGD